MKKHRGGERWNRKKRNRWGKGEKVLDYAIGREGWGQHFSKLR